MIEFQLPSLGADMDEGTLLEWKVKPGDVVSKGQVVAVVDTSKAAIDVECWHEGTVAELIVAPGEKVPVGTVLATLLEVGESAIPAAVPGITPAAAPPARKAVSPAARKRASELGVAVESLTGSGAGGAVTLADVEAAAASGEKAGGKDGDGVDDKVDDRVDDKVGDKAGDRVAEMRKAIAAAMSRSKREIPHYYLSQTIALSQALAWLGEENSRRRMGDRLLPAVILLKAVARTLPRYPELNGFFRDERFVASRAIHLGVAISLRQGGLVAPAILDADGKSLTQLMQDLTSLVQRTRAGSLRSSELSEPTVTVTALGDQGCDAVFGVIYPPQVALVGFGRIAERACVENGEVRALATVTASLAADHRVSDGHRGALFLGELRETLQHPEQLDADDSDIAGSQDSGGKTS